MPLYYLNRSKTRIIFTFYYRYKVNKVPTIELFLNKKDSLTKVEETGCWKTRLSKKELNLAIEK